MRQVFITKNCIDLGYSKIVKEAHLKVVLKQDDKVMSGIGFNLADKFSLLEKNRPIDIVYSIEENEWNGNKDLQLKIIDIRSSE